MDVFSAPPGELRDLAGSPDAVARFLTQAVACAPSVYGTAPWWFSATNGEVCVRADHERGLPIADPAGRELTISAARPSSPPGSPCATWAWCRRSACCPSLTFPT
jgi:hypothetical protein